MYPRCSRCDLYHSPNAPCPIECLSLYAKWLHVSGFRTSHSLYVDWKTLNPCGTINVVESIANALKLYQAGFTQTAGLFGNKLSAGQSAILEKMNVRYINWIIDNDGNNAGLHGALRAQEKYEDTLKFRIIVPPIEYGDVAEMPSDKLKMFLYMKGIKEQSS